MEKGETNMDFVKSLGGREKYYHKTNVKDCVIRAICNATGNDYKKTYDEVKTELIIYNRKLYRSSTKHNSPRNGVPHNVTKKYIEKVLGWTYHKIEPGSILGEYEFGKGTFLVNLNRHVTCIKDDVLYDSWDCSQGKGRKRNPMILGYWSKE